ncbi:hypothetical protein [Dendronalium phyllosphericum]
MSQAQCGKAINVHKFLMSRFLKEKWLEGSLYKDYTSHKIEGLNSSNSCQEQVIGVTKIEREKTFSGRGGGNEIKIIPISLASEFWLDQAIKGNVKKK